MSWMELEVKVDELMFFQLRDRLCDQGNRRRECLGSQTLDALFLGEHTWHDPTWVEVISLGTVPEELAGLKC